VSRRHATFSIANGKATLEDLKSKNGTFLNGGQIRRRMPLEDGDQVRVGPETIVFRTMSPGTTKSEKKS
jgi:pSer/pThr/pTyr-binding forkhead associated (FHA) protein